VRRDVVTGENIHVLTPGDVLGLVPRWPSETPRNGDTVDLKVVDDAVSSAVVVDVPVLVAVIVFSCDVIVVVVSTEPKNGNRLHQSSSFSADFVIVVVGGTQLLVDDGGWCSRPTTVSRGSVKTSGCLPPTAADDGINNGSRDVDGVTWFRRDVAADSITTRSRSRTLRSSSSTLT